MRATPRDAAIAHAELGRVLVPLLPGTGKPCRPWKHLRSTPLEAVAAHWPGDWYNPGILTEPSRVVVFDLDSEQHGTELPPEWARLGVRHGRDVLQVLAERAGQPVPPTHTTATYRDGEHLYFAAPADRVIRNSASKVGPMIDVRGRGGLAVGAGSVRAGRSYEVLDDRPPAPLPGWLATLADPPPPVQSQRPPVRIARRGGYGAAALAAEVEELLAAPRGTRNHSLNRAAFKLGTLVAIGELEQAEVMTALLSVAETLGLSGEDGTAQCERTIASGLTAGLDHPRNRVVA